jgi:hypothetical protein
MIFDFQDGGALTDFKIMLQTYEVVKTSSGNINFHVRNGHSAVVRPGGRVDEAYLRVGDNGYAPC